MGALGEIVLFVAEQTLRFLPWFLVAVALGAVLQGLSLDAVARRAFARGPAGIVLATAIGAFSPFCSFTVIPIIRGFLKAGVPLSVAMAFWFASPTMDPEIFALTAGILGIPIAVARLVAALAVSLGAGFVVLALERRKLISAPLRDDPEPAPARSPVQAALVPAGGSGPALAAGGAVAVAEAVPAAPASGCGSEAAAPVTSGCGAAAEPVTTGCGSAASAPDDRAWWRVAGSELRHLDLAQLGRTMVRDTYALGRWLVLAFVLQALIVLYLPQQVVLETLGVGGILSVPLAGFLGVPLYLNGVSAIPVVAGLLDKGMQPGAAVTFLIAGAVTTLPAIAAVRGVVNNRITALYLVLGLSGSIAIGLAANVFL